MFYPVCTVVSSGVIVTSDYLLPSQTSVNGWEVKDGLRTLPCKRIINDNDEVNIHLNG